MRKSAFTQVVVQLPPSSSYMEDSCGLSH